jgi:hypothetical protein
LLPTNLTVTIHPGKSPLSTSKVRHRHYSDQQQHDLEPALHQLKIPTIGTCIVLLLVMLVLLIVLSSAPEEQTSVELIPNVLAGALVPDSILVEAFAGPPGYISEMMLVVLLAQ